MERKIIAKERDRGPRGGDRQPAHEGGREGSGTRPGGRDTGQTGGKGGQGGGGKGGQGGGGKGGQGGGGKGSQGGKK